MNPLIWSMMITGLATSTIITMSSHHWMLAWLGLELNTLSILPIIMKSGHPRSTEATTKYFLIQAAAAALILFSSAMNAWETGQWTITHNLSPTAATMITIALMMKLGLAPVHAWYPEVLQSATMNTALVLSTWQKLAPLALLYLMNNNLPTQIMLIMGLTSALLGGWMGLNQTQTRKIMAFSSIAHMGWLVVALSLSPNLALTTTIIYITMTTTMFMSLGTTTTKTITDLGTTWTQSPPLIMLLVLSLMSLGGLPPLTGFAPKWLILTTLCTMKLMPMSVLLALASLPSLYFYIRMAYMTTLLSPPATTNTKYKWRLPNTINTMLPPMIMLSALLLPLAPLLPN
uniref:NADH-ubiquinone oxidoreductase chain 2 n=1 Tax=Luperosaurus macgregori TaxID=1183072 RepID=J9WJA2_9SAUR|nr:NADH dehydrogenase subunit 2 [Luperosaurus macgregori]